MSDNDIRHQQLESGSVIARTRFDTVIIEHNDLLKAAFGNDVAAGTFKPGKTDTIQWQGFDFQPMEPDDPMTRQLAERIANHCDRARQAAAVLAEITAGKSDHQLKLPAEVFNQIADLLLIQPDGRENEATIDRTRLERAEDFLAKAAQTIEFAMAKRLFYRVDGTPKLIGWGFSEPGKPLLGADQLTPTIRLGSRPIEEPPSLEFTWTGQLQQVDQLTLQFIEDQTGKSETLQQLPTDRTVCRIPESTIRLDGTYQLTGQWKKQQIQSNALRLGIMDLPNALQEQVAAAHRNDRHSTDTDDHFQTNEIDPQQLNLDTTAGIVPTAEPADLNRTHDDGDHILNFKVTGVGETGFPVQLTWSNTDPQEHNENQGWFTEIQRRYDNQPWITIADGMPTSSHWTDNDEVPENVKIVEYRIRLCSGDQVTAWNLYQYTRPVPPPQPPRQLEADIPDPANPTVQLTWTAPPLPPIRQSETWATVIQRQINNQDWQTVQTIDRTTTGQWHDQQIPADADLMNYRIAHHRTDATEQTQWVTLQAPMPIIHPPHVTISLSYSDEPDEQVTIAWQLDKPQDQDLITLHRKDHQDQWQTIAQDIPAADAQWIDQQVQQLTGRLEYRAAASREQVTGPWDHAAVDMPTNGPDIRIDPGEKRGDPVTVRWAIPDTDNPRNWQVHIQRRTEKGQWQSVAEQLPVEPALWTDTQPPRNQGTVHYRVALIHEQNTSRWTEHAVTPTRPPRSWKWPIAAACVLLLILLVLLGGLVYQNVREKWITDLATLKAQVEQARKDAKAAHAVELAEKDFNNGQQQFKSADQTYQHAIDTAWTKEPYDQAAEKYHQAIARFQKSRSDAQQRYKQMQAAARQAETAQAEAEKYDAAKLAQDTWAKAGKALENGRNQFNALNFEPTCQAFEQATQQYRLAQQQAVEKVSQAAKTAKKAYDQARQAQQDYPQPLKDALIKDTRYLDVWNKMANAIVKGEQAQRQQQLFNAYEQFNTVSDLATATTDLLAELNKEHQQNLKDMALARQQALAVKANTNTHAADSWNRAQANREAVAGNLDKNHDLKAANLAARQATEDYKVAFKQTMAAYQQAVQEQRDLAEKHNATKYLPKEMAQADKMMHQANADKEDKPAQAVERYQQLAQTYKQLAQKAGDIEQSLDDAMTKALKAKQQADNAGAITLANTPMKKALATLAKANDLRKQFNVTQAIEHYNSATDQFINAHDRAMAMLAEARRQARDKQSDTTQIINTLKLIPDPGPLAERIKKCIDQINKTNPKIDNANKLANDKPDQAYDQFIKLKDEFELIRKEASALNGEYLKYATVRKQTEEVRKQVIELDAGKNNITLFQRAENNWANAEKAWKQAKPPAQAVDRWQSALKDYQALLKPMQEVKAATRQVVLQVWDHDRVDGDAISVKLNGQLVAKRIDLTNDIYKQNLTLKRGINRIIITSLDTGGFMGLDSITTVSYKLVDANGKLLCESGTRKKVVLEEGKWTIFEVFYNPTPGGNP